MTKTSASASIFSTCLGASGTRWRALALATLGAVACAGEALAEGSADLIKRNKGFRAALLAADPALGIAAPDGRQSVSLHFAYLNEGEVLNLSSSAQGVGGGQIVYRDPTGMSNRCDPDTGLIPDRTIEQAGPAAGAPCSVRVEPGQAGVWEVEFKPPTSAAPDLAAYQPVSSGEDWSPQQAGDFWVRAWDVSVSNAPLDEGGRLLPGRVFVRSFAAIVGQDADAGAPWHAIWFGRSSDGFIYALDTNGLMSGALTLLGTTRGLKDADGDSLYGSVSQDALGQTAFIADPYATSDEHALKLYYSRPDQGQPASSVSALMGEEWLTAPMVDPQTLTDLSFDAETGQVVVTVAGEGMSNALELFAADATGPEAPALVSVTNLESGVSRFDLPAGIGGAVIGRLTAKQAELHFPLANIPGNPNGLRLRRMNGSKDGAGDVSWNLGESTGRFDGQAVTTANSLRAPAGVWRAEQGLGRVNDLWTMAPVRSERALDLPTTETDVQLALELLSIEPTADAGVQSAQVALSVRNGGEQDTGDVRIDLADASGLDISGVEGLFFDGEAFLIDTLAAGEGVLGVFNVRVAEVEQPFAVALTQQALTDSDPSNDLAVIFFPEPVQTEAIASEAAESEPLDAEQVVAAEIEAPTSSPSAALAPALAPRGTVTLIGETGAEPDAALIELPIEEAIETPLPVDAASTPERAALINPLQFKIDLIALRKRPNSDQAEADFVLALSNASSAAVTDMSVDLMLRETLGEAFVGLVGAPVFEVPPTQAASLLVLDPGFTGQSGADQLIIQGGSLFPSDNALVRLTVHYDPDALGGVRPLGLSGKARGVAQGEVIEVASDNDFSGGARDENADGDPLNDPTPLPGLRLVKAERVFPGPTDRAAYPTAYDAVFEYTIENTGGMPLQDIALADFFLENEAVKAVLEVDVQALQSDSQTFTASRLPGSFIGLDTVQRFENGVATLLPGETLTVVAEVVFAFDAERMDQDLLSRAAAFSQVDLDGDGQLDTVVIDPADMGRSAGFDANGDGEEGNDVLPLSIGRLAVSTVLDGGLVMSASGQGDSLVLTAETTVRNTGVAPLGRVSADLPLPEGWRDALLAVIAPPSIVSTPRDDFDVITRQGYDGLRGVRAIEGIETLAAGEQVRFAVTLELDPLAIDPASLSLLQASARAELDRDQDGLGDLTLDAVQAPTELVLSTGESLIDGLIAAQADPADAPAADPTPPGCHSAKRAAFQHGLYPRQRR